MKLSYLIIVCLVIKWGDASAQQALSLDTLVKRLHVKTITLQEYDSTGKKTLNSIIENYDLEGRMIEKISTGTYSYTISLSPLPQKTHEFIYYDTNGNVTNDRTITYGQNDSTPSTSRFSYSLNKRGWITKSLCLSSYLIDTTLKEPIQKTTFSYNKQGEVKSMKTKNIFKLKNKYDKKGHLIERNEWGRYVPSDFIKYTYDSVGKLIKSEDFFDSTISITSLYYNAKGQLIRQLMTSRIKKEEVPYDEYDWTIFYDIKGLKIKIIKKGDFDNKPNSTIYSTYTYTFY